MKTTIGVIIEGAVAATAAAAAHQFALPTADELEKYASIIFQAIIACITVYRAFTTKKTLNDKSSPEGV